MKHTIDIVTALDIESGNLVEGYHYCVPESVSDVKKGQDLEHFVVYMEGYTFCESKVDPKTIRRYTGQYDKKGTPIREGDIVCANFRIMGDGVESKSISLIGLVRYSPEFCVFEVCDLSKMSSQDLWSERIFTFLDMKLFIEEEGVNQKDRFFDAIVIGNDIDNKDMIKILKADQS